MVRDVVRDVTNAISIAKKTARNILSLDQIPCVLLPPVRGGPAPRNKEVKFCVLTCVFFSEELDVILFFYLSDHEIH